MPAPVWWFGSGAFGTCADRADGREAGPLVLVHSRTADAPSSFVELLKLVPLVTDPGAHGGDEHDSFDVVVPSRPGYAFSGRPSHPGRGASRDWANLWEALAAIGQGVDRRSVKASRSVCQIC
jgi:pimeloyl-ACP methyl ester carboxylesterase